MSNLYKSRFVINNNTGKRIIDSNEKATERMEDYIRLKREEALADGEFIEGLDAESVEVVEDAQELEEPHAEENVNEEEQAQDILEAAKAEADQILEDAKMQAEHMREQAIEEGQKEGYRSGQEQAMQEIETEQNRLRGLQEDLRRDYEAKCAELEPKLVDVITGVVEKCSRFSSRIRKMCCCTWYRTRSRMRMDVGNSGFIWVRTAMRMSVNTKQNYSSAWEKTYG